MTPPINPSEPRLEGLSVPLLWEMVIQVYSTRKVQSEELDKVPWGGYSGAFADWHHKFSANSTFAITYESL